jgi:hypothetical protein
MHLSKVAALLVFTLESGGSEMSISFENRLATLRDGGVQFSEINAALEMAEGSSENFSAVQAAIKDGFRARITKLDVRIAECETPVERAHFERYQSDFSRIINQLESGEAAHYVQRGNGITIPASSAQNDHTVRWSWAAATIRA